jgi:hypothetical protein
MRNLQINMPKSFLLSLLIAVGSTSALVAGDPRLCAMQARDYANVMAPRTGAPALKQPPGLPTPNQRDARPEAMRMVPNDDAYRRAYEACMSRG